MSHIMEQTEAHPPLHLEDATSQIQRDLLEGDDPTSASSPERLAIGEYEELREELEELDELDESVVEVDRLTHQSEDDPIVSSAPDYLSQKTARSTQLTSPPRNQRNGRFEDEDKTELHVPPQQRSPQPAPMHEWPPKSPSAQSVPAQVRPIPQTSHAGRTRQVTQIKPPPRPEARSQPSYKGRS